MDLRVELTYASIAANSLTLIGSMVMIAYQWKRGLNTGTNKLVALIGLVNILLQTVSLLKSTMDPVLWDLLTASFIILTISGGTYLDLAILRCYAILVSPKITDSLIFKLRLGFALIALAPFTVKIAMTVLNVNFLDTTLLVTDLAFGLTTIIYEIMQGITISYLILKKSAKSASQVSLHRNLVHLIAYVFLLDLLIILIVATTDATDISNFHCETEFLCSLTGFHSLMLFVVFEHMKIFTFEPNPSSFYSKDRAYTATQILNTKKLTDIVILIPLIPNESRIN